MEPLYYEGHKAKLEALISLFQTRGDPLVGIHLNHDEINSAEFGKLIEQSRGCVEQLRLVVKLDKRP